MRRRRIRRGSAGVRIAPETTDAAPLGSGTASVGMLLREPQWKLSPQAQLPCAFGLSIEKPYFWIESSKSIEAPSR
jgi:hypothetical protein